MSQFQDAQSASTGKSEEKDQASQECQISLDISGFVCPALKLCLKKQTNKRKIPKPCTGAEALLCDYEAASKYL